jgi:Cutinase
MSFSKHAKLAAISLALASFTASTPVLLGTENMSPERVREITWSVDRSMLAAFECQGQSCVLADTSGSTGRMPNMKAEGANEADVQCIVKHNPVIGDFIQKYDNKLPDVPKQNTGISSALATGLNLAWRPLIGATGSKETGSFTGNCTENILIYARGTMEPGALGISVGPALAKALPSGWSSVGVDYDADIPGCYCLGLPGGMVAKDVINQAASRCPGSNIFVSGYSQGAMVIRNGLARADPSAKAKVKVRIWSHAI